MARSGLSRREGRESVKAFPKHGIALGITGSLTADKLNLIIAAPPYLFRVLLAPRSSLRPSDTVRCNASACPQVGCIHTPHSSCVDRVTAWPLDGRFNDCIRPVVRKAVDQNRPGRLRIGARCAFDSVSCRNANGAGRQ